MWQSSDGVYWYIDLEFQPEGLAYYPTWLALRVARYVHTVLSERVSLYALITRKHICERSGYVPWNSTRGANDRICRMESCWPDPFHCWKNIAKKLRITGGIDQNHVSAPPFKKDGRSIRQRELQLTLLCTTNSFTISKTSQSTASSASPSMTFCKTEWSQFATR